MPATAIVLSMKFNRILGKVWSSEEMLDYMSHRFQRSDENRFLRDLSELHPRVEAIAGDQILASFVTGTAGDIKIGLLKSLYNGFFDFWICSTDKNKCFKGRRWIMKNCPALRERTRREILNDLFFGAYEIPREKLIGNYVLRNGLNMGLLVNSIVLSAKSAYEYHRFGDLDFRLPLLVVSIWLASLFLTALYYRKKVLYVVKET